MRSRWDKLEIEERAVLEDKRQVSRDWVKIERKHVAHQEKRERWVHHEPSGRMLGLIFHSFMYSFEKEVSQIINFLPSDQVVKFNVGGQVRSSPSSSKRYALNKIDIFINGQSVDTRSIFSIGTALYSGSSVGKRFVWLLFL